jgi:hypothetical protein
MKNTIKSIILSILLISQSTNCTSNVVKKSFNEQNDNNLQNPSANTSIDQSGTSSSNTGTLILAILAFGLGGTGFGLGLWNYFQTKDLNNEVADIRAEMFRMNFNILNNTRGILALESRLDHLEDVVAHIQDLTIPTLPYEIEDNKVNFKLPIIADTITADTITAESIESLMIQTSLIEKLGPFLLLQGVTSLRYDSGALTGSNSDGNGIYTLIPGQNGGIQSHQIFRSTNGRETGTVPLDIDGIKMEISASTSYKLYSGSSTFDCSAYKIQIGDNSEYAPSTPNYLDEPQIYLSGKSPVIGNFVDIPRDSSNVLIYRAIKVPSPVEFAKPIRSTSNVLIQSINPDTGGNITSTLSTNNGALRAS